MTVLSPDYISKFCFLTRSISAVTEVNRQTLTKSRATELAVAGLKHEDEDVQIFAVRYIANICFNSSASFCLSISDLYLMSGAISF